MKLLNKTLVTVMILLTMVACNTSDKNPLLQSFQTPYHTPPFDQLKHEHYVPAFEAAIDEARKETDAIVSNNEAPTFGNTIEALAFSGQRLTTVASIFFNLNSAETDETMQQSAREVSPMLTDFQNDVLFNEDLFNRVKQVYESRQQLTLTTEQQMLLENTYKGFSRNGANLNAEDKEKMRVISRELSDLTLRFSDNVLAETNGWFLHITDEKDLAGLPESVKETAAESAKAKNVEGWAITLHAPSFMPFMRYADNRDLRKQVYMAFSSRGNQSNEYNNIEILTKIANLRLESANILGYATHADYVLEERMAKNAPAVNSFLQQLSDASMPAAREEFKAVQQFAKANGFNEDLQAWDWSYYSEMLRKEKYDFDEELTRPYFELEKVTQGIFEFTNKLWGLTYVPNSDIPVYHKDVTAYEVYDEDGKFLSVLYLDFFPREGKSPGAWMTSYREQYRKDGEDHRPHVSLVCNFTKPTDTKPSLLTFNEVTTFLHEFGHGLHGMMSDVNYQQLAGTSVYRDFVELPSQILENWATEKEFLDMFAVHYETGEPIPAEMVEKIKQVDRFNAAYAAVRQLSFGLNDMAWHSITEPFSGDVVEFERQAMEPVRVFPYVDGTLMSSAFSHIFAGGYSAGYYSYKWAEVLDADAFKAFKQNGIFDKTTAKSFRDHILSRGGSEHPMQLFVKFRGQEPTIEALLERDGFVVKN